MKQESIELRKWWKQYYVGRSKYRAKELEMWNEGVTFDDVYNLIRANGPQDPERGVEELVWKPEYGNKPYARQCLYRKLAKLKNINGGQIDLS